MDKFTQRLLAEFKDRGSELARYPVQEKDGYIEIIIESARPEVPDIVLSTEDSEVTVFFPPSHNHIWFEGRPLQAAVDEVESFIEQLIDEELIAFKAKGRFLSWEYGGFESREKIEQLKERGRLIRANSWKGTVMHRRSSET